MSRPIEKGRYCSRRAWAVPALAFAFLIACQGAVAADLATPQATKKGESKSAAAATSPAKPLELYRGRARELLSDTQWEQILASQPINLDESDTSAPEPEVVKVKGERVAPEVPDGIAALFWAIRHPTQAWRIFAPD